MMEDPGFFSFKSWFLRVRLTSI